MATTLYDFTHILSSTESLLKYDGITANSTRIVQDTIIETVNEKLTEGKTISVYYGDNKVIEFDQYQVNYISSYITSRGWFLEVIYNALNDEEFPSRQYYITFGHDVTFSMIIIELLQIASATNQSMKILVEE